MAHGDAQLLAQRADLRVAFPEVPGASEAAFLAWVARDLAEQDPAWPLVRNIASRDPS